MNLDVFPVINRSDFLDRRKFSIPPIYSSLLHASTNIYDASIFNIFEQNTSDVQCRQQICHLT